MRSRQVHSAAARAARPLVLVTLVAAAAAALGGVSSAAPPAAAAGACASLANTRSFHGQASASFDEDASGADPGSGGTETIDLEHNADHLVVNLTHKRANGPLVVFTGKVSGGSLVVQDSFQNTGTTQSGQESYSGPVNADFSFATLTLDTTDCKYLLQVSFSATTSYTGDPSIQPDAGVTGAMYSGAQSIPSTLHLRGAVGTADAYDSCQESIGGPLPPCYQVGGGWVTDFETLVTCHATSGNCPSGEQAVGTALLTWKLTPHIAFPKKK